MLAIKIVDEANMDLENAKVKWYASLLMAYEASLLRVYLSYKGYLPMFKILNHEFIG
jgi:hypothetical protein